jgi:parallel beta-helix repeat protein
VAIQPVRTSGAHTSRYIIISGNTFDNGWGGGLYLVFNSDYCLVENNVFANCGVTTTYPKPCLQVGGSHNTFRKNVFYNPTNQAMSIESHDEVDQCYSVCEGNYIYNNTLFMSSQYAIQMFVGNNNCPTCAVENNVIANNIFYKTDRLCWTEGVERFKILIRLELYHSNDEHNWVNPDVYGNFPETTAWGHNQFWNNLFRYDQRGLAPDTMVLYSSDMHNLHGAFYTYSIGELESDGSGSWANNIGNDPLLRSEDPNVYGISSGWWYLREGSPCIDAGMAIVDPNGSFMRDNYPGYGWGNLGYAGVAPDIGAYEFNGENPAPPIPPALNGVPGHK